MLEPSPLAAADRLGGFTGMDPAVVSAALERLVRFGLVTKTTEPDPETGEMAMCWTLVYLPSSSDRRNAKDSR